MAEQYPTNAAGVGATPARTATTWEPAPETDAVRSAAAGAGLGTLRLARKEPGPAGEFVRGLGVAAGSVVALIVIGLLLEPFGDAGWVKVFRGLLIVLIAGVFIGLIRAIRALVRARMAIYLYDYGLVGTARSSVRTIRWDQVTQLVVFSSEGVHLTAEGRQMIIPPALVGAGVDEKAQFLGPLVPPVEQRGVEVMRF